MALELLSGPVDITVDATPVASATGFTWLQGVGLLAVVNPGAAYGFYAVQMDGSAQGPRSSFNGSGAGLVLDLRSNRGLAAKSGAFLYNFNWLAGNPDATPFLSPGVTIAGGHDIHVIAPDRYLQFSSGTPMQVLWSADGVTFTAEYTFSIPAGYTLLSVSRGRSTTEVCIAYTNGSLGQIRFYDVVKKAQVGRTLSVGESPDGVWYVPKYDIFVEIKSLQVKILANAVEPATLSNPAALTAVTAGVVSQIRAQLLGAQSEPCVGELIDWSITSGDGSLTVPQSATDASGYAYNGLVVPLGSSVSPVVDAQLSY